MMGMMNTNTQGGIVNDIQNRTSKATVYERKLA